MESLIYKLEAYEGPLDLLLNLIRRHEIDIHNIPIATLTEQYLAEIANLPPDMGNLSEFLVMAATLLEIKSRMLLPRPQIEAETGEEIDPREALVQKLLEYQRAQALAEELKNLQPEGEKVTRQGGDAHLIKELRDIAKSTFETKVNTVAQLMEIFTDAINRKEWKRDIVRSGYGKVARDNFTIPEKVLTIRHALKISGRASLLALIADCQSKNEMVVTFLAVLEMIRQGEVQVNQPDTFADVEILPKGAEMHV